MGIMMSTAHRRSSLSYDADLGGDPIRLGEYFCDCEWRRSGFRSELFAGILIGVTEEEG